MKTNIYTDVVVADDGDRVRTAEIAMAVEIAGLSDRLACYYAACGLNSSNVIFELQRRIKGLVQ